MNYKQSPICSTLFVICGLCLFCGVVFSVGSGAHAEMLSRADKGWMYGALYAGLLFIGHAIPFAIVTVLSSFSMEELTQHKFFSSATTFNANSLSNMSKFFTLLFCAFGCVSMFFGLFSLLISFFIEIFANDHSWGARLIALGVVGAILSALCEMKSKKLNN